jgi:hypothetical protein
MHAAVTIELVADNARSPVRTFAFCSKRKQVARSVSLDATDRWCNTMFKKQYESSSIHALTIEHAVVQSEMRRAQSMEDLANSPSRQQNRRPCHSDAPLRRPVRQPSERTMIDNNAEEGDVQLTKRRGRRRDYVVVTEHKMRRPIRRPSIQSLQSDSPTLALSNDSDKNERALK